MDRKAAFLNITVCLAIGGIASAFTPARWLAASLWVFAALFINGTLAFYEDAQPGGFENPDGTTTPVFAKGRGAARFWLQSILVSLGAVALGLYVQFA